jgi:hypothetical protein
MVRPSVANEEGRAIAGGPFTVSKQVMFGRESYLLRCAPSITSEPAKGVSAKRTSLGCRTCTVPAPQEWAGLRKSARTLV